MMLAFAAISAGCSSTGNVSDGAGYSLLTPSAATRAAIVGNDRPFAEQVAAHNRQCRADAGCQK
jgi:hypothetical protein